MDLEELTKHQIILLTLFVSFITSIATGIVTVSLMSQAPVGVTRVVNQIVEHTVQTVVPATQGAAAATVTEKTVVVKDDDLTAQSIAAVQKAIVRIVAKGGNTLVARGVIVGATSATGTVMTDRSALENSSASEFEAILNSGTRVPVVFDDSGATTTPIAMVSLVLGTSTGFAPAKLTDVSALALGQSVIRIGGVGADNVDVGVISVLPVSSGTAASNIEANVSSVTPGAVLVTLFGEVIGITTSDSAGNGPDFYSVLPPPSSAETKVPAST